MITQKILETLQRDRDSRVQNHSLLLDDLRELGMFGELSEDNNYINMSFEDVHRLVTVILRYEVHARRQAKLDDMKFQLDAENCPNNMSTLLAELERAKRELTQNHSFQSVGAFEGISCTASRKLGPLRDASYFKGPELVSNAFHRP